MGSRSDASLFAFPQRVDESAVAKRLMSRLLAHGCESRKVDDRYGGLPDYLTVDARCDTFFIETKVVKKTPQWSVKESGLRTKQVQFFRRWHGRAYIAAYIPNIDWWIIGCSQDHHLWGEFLGEDAAACAVLGLYGKTLPRQPVPWLTPIDD